MKICFKCGIEKSLNLFYKHSQMKDGRLNKCIECAKNDVHSNNTDYDKTEKGVVRVIYKTQKSNSKKREDHEVGYSKQQLHSWLYFNGFKSLFDKWVSSGYVKSLKPSVDRLDDFKGYSFDNIRLVTWGENKAHQLSDIALGVGTSGARCKKVVKKDREGVVLAVYVSQAEAGRCAGYRVERQVKSGKPCRNGFYWSYAS